MDVTTGCLQTFAGKKLPDSKGGKTHQGRGPTINHPWNKKKVVFKSIPLKTNYFIHGKINPSGF